MATNDKQQSGFQFRTPEQRQLAQERQNNIGSYVRGVQQRIKQVPQYVRQNAQQFNVFNEFNPQNTSSVIQPVRQFAQQTAQKQVILPMWTKPVLQTADKIGAPPRKFLEGVVEGSAMGLIDVPEKPSTTGIQKGAYTAGYGFGMLNPLNPLNKAGLFTKLDNIGKSGVVKILPKATGMAKRAAQAIAGETAQSLGYAGAATAAGKVGLRENYELTPTNFAMDVASGLGLRGITRGQGKNIDDIMKRGEALGIKGVSPNVNKVHPEDLDVMRQFADEVLRNKATKKPLGELGTSAQRLAEHYFGGDWKYANNKKLAQAFEWAIDLNMNIPREARGKLPSPNLVSDKPGQSVVSQLRPQPTKGVEAQDFEFNVGSGKQKVRIIDTPEGRRIQDLGTESIPMTSKQYLESQILRQEPGQTASLDAQYRSSDPNVLQRSKLRTQQTQEKIAQRGFPQQQARQTQKLGSESIQRIRESGEKANTKPLKVSSSDGIIPPNVEQEIRNTQRAVDKKVNLLDYMRTPDRVLKKIGLEKEAKLIRQQYNRYLDELPKEIDKVTQWYNRVKNNPEAEVRIFRYLDGQKQQLPPEELKVAKEIQAYLQNWADRLDLPQDKRIASYITHIFENDFIQKEFDPDVAKIIAGKLPGSVYDPFLQKRLGQQGYVEDVFRALDAYVKRATRKVNMDPALKQLESRESKLDLASWDYVKNYTDRINLRPTTWDELLDNAIKQSPIGYKFGQRPVTALSKSIRQMVYRGTLGLNVGSAIRNLTQGVNTYSQLGEKYTSVGLMKALRSVASRDSELVDVGVLRNTLIEDRTLSSTKKFWENMDKGLFFLFEAAEKLNRGTAYYGAKSRALSQGKTEKEAIEAGLEMARKTQFTFGSVDTPVALQSDLVKLATQFQSYNVKQTEFLAEMVKNKEFLGVARWLGANAVILATVGQAMGWDWKDFVPFGGVLEGKSPIGNTPAFQFGTDLMKATTGGEDKYGNKVGVKQLLKDTVPFIPAGVQAKKTIEGISAANRGYSQSDSGLARFPISQDVSTRIKTATLGQYSTQEARDYFNKDRSVLGETQTEVLSQLPNSQRKEYYNAVITKREADKAENEQLKAIESGNTKLATSTSEKIIKAKLEAGVPVSEQELSTVYLSQALKMPKSNRYETSQRNSALWNKSGSLYDNEDLTAEQKEILQNRIASELGVSRQDLDIYQVAKQDNDSKTLYAYDKLDQSQSFDDFMRYLVNGRKPINGKILVSDGVINNLVEDGLIPEALGDDIKDIDLKEDGTLKTGTKSRKKSAAARAKATNDYFEDLKKIKVGTSFTRGGTQAQRINTKNLTFSGA